MDKKIDRLSRYWWVVPTLFVVISAGVAAALLGRARAWLTVLLIGAWLVSCAAMFVDFLILVCRKLWIQAGGTIVLGVMSAGIVFIPFVRMGIRLTLKLLLALMWQQVEPSDGFARQHPIPEGLEYAVPMEGECQSDFRIYYPSIAVDSTDTASYLQIWCDHEPGRYLYDFYYPALPAGTIFLKCHEVGDNIPLSTKQMTRNTSVKHGETGCFSQIVDKQGFVIYEGDWGEPYAVRAEVWHRDSASNKETKLMEKPYCMEGWMR